MLSSGVESPRTNREHDELADTDSKIFGRPRITVHLKKVLAIFGSADYGYIFGFYLIVVFCLILHVACKVLTHDRRGEGRDVTAGFFHCYFVLKPVCN